MLSQESFESPSRCSGVGENQWREARTFHFPSPFFILAKFFAGHAFHAVFFCQSCIYFFFEDILVQIQEEQRQFPRRFTRRLHQVGKKGHAFQRYGLRCQQSVRGSIRVEHTHIIKCCLQLTAAPETSRCLDGHRPLYLRHGCGRVLHSVAEARQAPITH